MKSLLNYGGSPVPQGRVGFCGGVLCRAFPRREGHFVTQAATLIELCVDRYLRSVGYRTGDVPLAVGYSASHRLASLPGITLFACGFVEASRLALISGHPPRTDLKNIATLEPFLFSSTRVEPPVCHCSEVNDPPAHQASHVTAATPCAGGQCSTTIGCTANGCTTHCSLNYDCMFGRWGGGVRISSTLGTVGIRFGFRVKIRVRE